MAALIIIPIIIILYLSYNYFIAKFSSNYINMSKWSLFFIILIFPPLGLPILLYSLMKKMEGKKPLHHKKNKKHKGRYPMYPPMYPY